METKIRGFRLDEERWKNFKELAATEGLNASEAIIKFIEAALAHGSIETAIHTSVKTTASIDIDTILAQVTTAAHEQLEKKIDLKLQQLRIELKGEVKKQIDDLFRWERLNKNKYRRIYPSV